MQYVTNYDKKNKEVNIFRVLSCAVCTFTLATRGFRLESLKRLPRFNGIPNTYINSQLWPPQIEKFVTFYTQFTFRSLFRWTCPLFCRLLKLTCFSLGDLSIHSEWIYYFVILIVGKSQSSIITKHTSSNQWWKIKLVFNWFVNINFGAVKLTGVVVNSKS